MDFRYRWPRSGYAWVSATKQGLDRQIDALRQEGIAAKRIYVDKKSGANTNRPGLHAALDQARGGDVIVVHTLDRRGRAVRDTLSLIHDLADRGAGVRNLADPIRVDSSNPEAPMSQLAVVMLALFGQMERTYAIERAAHVHAVATSKGRWIGRPSVVDPTKLAYADHLRNEGHTIAQIMEKTGTSHPARHSPSPPRTTAPATSASDRSSCSARDVGSHCGFGFDAPNATPEDHPRERNQSRADHQSAGRARVAYPLHTSTPVTTTFRGLTKPDKGEYSTDSKSIAACYRTR